MHPPQDAAPLPSLHTATVDAVLAARAEDTPDAPFLHFGSDTVTYAQMHARAERAAAGLRRSGIGPGDRVAIAAANAPEWLVAYFACCRLGAVLVTLNVAYREREFVYMLGQSGARLLLCDERSGEFEFRPFLDALRPRITSVERIAYFGAPAAEDSWENLVAAGADTIAGSAAAPAPASSPGSPAVILYTSGTTGDPKGATLTHRSLLASAAAQAERFGQKPDDVALGVMPFNHVGGLTCTIGASLVSGGAVALLPRFHPDLVAQVVPARRVTMFVGVPTMYRMMLGSEQFAACDVSSVRLCVVGGSNLEPELAGQVRDRFGGPRLANLYGLSETSGACIISPAGDTFEQVATSIGTALTGFEARIAADDGAPLPTGEAGELQVRGACVAAGYWEAPDATAGAFGGDGWLSTGDIGTLSDDGHVTLLARKKEMYVRGGYNVYPAEVENLLATDPSVAMCAVIGVPDSTFGETGHAFVVPAPDAAVDTAALLRLCAASLAEYKVPARIEVVDALPMTPAGKIRKVLLTPAN
ncbi:class I adenylate-forming enzyme family protein [Tomitella gaofuii]|uniref:class I adenylate-forming enzyme family protein n=1 Tax=Tomitella gaofuii TaxID=2760083 RepID=UPI0015F7EF33|nr:AMP-binding protein [Tomitella gaofuii]